MKLSIIVPVYNEKEAMVHCLNAVLSQDYPKEDYEVIVVNDGSSDGTREVVEKYQVRLINLEANSGRILAREIGAKTAKFDLLLFVDSRYLMQGKDFLKGMASVAYQPLFPVAVEKKSDSPLHTLFYLMRKKWYRPYYPFDNYPQEFWIDEDNFDKVPKGMSVVLIDKSLFLSCIPHDKGKMVNDDTRLLREVVRRKKILRHSDIKVAYIQRTGFRKVMRHIYERGPRFADYYLKKGGRYRKAGLTILWAFLFFIVMGFFRPDVLLSGMSGLLLMDIGVGIWLAEDIKDFFIVLMYLPLITLAFGAGILRGILSNEGILPSSVT